MRTRIFHSYCMCIYFTHKQNSYILISQCIPLNLVLQVFQPNFFVQIIIHRTNKYFDTLLIKCTRNKITDILQYILNNIPRI